MRDLPPIGSRVRLVGGAVGTVDEHREGQAFGRPLTPYAFVAHVGGRWHPTKQKHGAWVMADEIEEVLSDELAG